MKHTLKLFSIINAIHQKEDLSTFENKIIDDLSKVEKEIISTHKLEKNTYRFPTSASFKTYEAYYDGLLVIDDILVHIKHLVSKSISLKNAFPSPNVFYVNDMADFTSFEQNATLLKKLKAISTSGSSEIFTNQATKSPLSIFSSKIIKDLTPFQATKNLFEKTELTSDPESFLNPKFYTRLMKHFNISHYYLSKEHLDLIITSILKKEKNSFVRTANFYKFFSLLNWSLVTLLGLYFNQFLRIPFFSNNFDIPIVGSSFAPTLVDIFIHIGFLMSASLWYVSTPIDKETKSSEVSPILISLLPFIYLFFIDTTFFEFLNFELIVKSFLFLSTLIFNIIFFKVLSFNYNQKKRVVFHAITTILVFVKFAQFDLFGFFIFFILYWLVIIGVKMTKRG